MAEQPDVVLVGLDLQSNSARQTVGACNRLGLRTVLVLEGARPREVQGNLLVDYLLGAEIHFAPDRTEQRRMLDRLAEDCRQRGERPHILNDNPMFDVASAIAYLETTMEMIEQLRAAGTAPTVLYMSSSGKGQAGLELARKLWGGFRVHGVTATREYDVPARTAAIANETAATLGLDVRVHPEDVVNFDDFVGLGYGRPSAESKEAVQLFARMEGLVLDPVYTGKCAAALIAHARDGRLTKGDTAVFVHTGGAPAIFTWSHLWTDDGAGAPDGRS
jgi:D-cysteine desulfhydrase/L-cysteate sulfo-lyase